FPDCENQADPHKLARSYQALAVINDRLYGDGAGHWIHPGVDPVDFTFEHQVRKGITAGQDLLVAVQQTQISLGNCKAKLDALQVIKSGDSIPRCQVAAD